MIMNRSDFKYINEGDRIRNVRTQSKGPNMSSYLFTVTNNDVINDILSLTSTMGETHPYHTDIKVIWEKMVQQSKGVIIV